MDGADTGFVNYLSQGGAWGMFILFVIWWAREQSLRVQAETLRVKAAQDVADALQAKLTSAIEKRVEDVQLYASALRDLTQNQHEVIRDASMAMAAVTSTLEHMRSEGYLLSRRKSQPPPLEGETS